jgi:hypothetical protein
MDYLLPALAAVWGMGGAPLTDEDSSPSYGRRRCLLDRTGVLHRDVHQALLGAGADNPLSE